MTDSGDNIRRDAPAADSAQTVPNPLRPTLRSTEAAPEGDPDKLAHFVVLGRLGQGGMGLVYRAKDEKLDRIVALKVLPRAFETDEGKRRRLIREARVAAALSHPNLATIYEIGESEGRVFIAMELVEGRPLRALLGARPLAVQTTLHLIAQAAAAVAEAHASGVVHRDLKPENILVTADHHVKVLDFGLAKRTIPGDVLVTGTGAGESMLFGTPAYMAPEQARGQPVTPATDVFALGIVLYEALTARRPFTGVNLPQIVRSIERDAPAAPSSISPLVPGAFDTIIARCLAKDPAERYPNAHALLDELRKLDSVGLATTEAHPAPDSRVTRGPSARGTPAEPDRRWILPLAGALGVAGLLVAAALSMQSRTNVVLPPVAPSVSAVASGRPRAITEWPPPRTSSPEAATLYAEALQAFRDASTGAFEADLERAVALDPHFAAAHLRLALGSGSLEKQRDHRAAATQARASLDSRDRRLLAFAEASGDGMAVNPPTSETLDMRRKAARELARALPDDAEALLYAAEALWDWASPPDAGPGQAESFALLDRVADLDPKFAMVESLRAYRARASGDGDAEEAAIERCLEIAPNAASCLRERASHRSERGQCRELEDDARQMVAVEPGAWRGYGYLWIAIAANGASVEALQSIMKKEEAAVPDADLARRFALQDAADLAIWSGDLVSAESSLRALQKAEAGLADESKHVAEWQLVYVYDEQGATTKAADLSEDYLRRLPAWTHDEPTWGREAALAALRRAGRVSEAHAKAMWEAWRAEWAPKLHGSLEDGRSLFLYAWAETPSEAHEAVATAPIPVSPNGPGPWAWGVEGRVRALTGDADGAIPLLRQGAARCGEVPYGHRASVPIDWMMDQMHDRLLLGQMLEQKSDRDGACGQYASVLARWGSAKPRSITAEQARARSKTIGCR
ncbi:MAG: protein kinase [Polyangiaceae bacterium]